MRNLILLLQDSVELRARYVVSVLNIVDRLLLALLQVIEQLKLTLFLSLRSLQLVDNLVNLFALSALRFDGIATHRFQA